MGKKRPLHVPGAAWRRYSEMSQKWGRKDRDIERWGRLIFDPRMEEVFVALEKVLTDERDWHLFFMSSADALALVADGGQQRKDLASAVEEFADIAEQAKNLANKLDLFRQIYERSGIEPQAATAGSFIDLMDLLFASCERGAHASFRVKLLPTFERASRLASSRARSETPRPSDLIRTIARNAEETLANQVPFIIRPPQYGAALNSRKGTEKSFPVRDYILNLDSEIDNRQYDQPDFYSRIRFLKRRHRLSAILAACALAQKNVDIKRLTQAVKQVRVRVTIRRNKVH